MKKNLFLLLLASGMLMGCAHTSSSQQSQENSSSSNNTVLSSSNVDNVSSESSSNVSSSIINNTSSINSESEAIVESSASTSSSSSNESISSNISSVTSIESSSSINSNSSISSSTSQSSTTQSSTTQSSSSTVVSYDGYYSSISPSMSGNRLQEELCRLIARNYNDLSYKGLLAAYRETDCKPGTNIIWDMYSNEEFVCGGPKENKSYSKEGDGYNREHSVPQSYFSERTPMKSDLFHVYPTDGYVNNRRSNFPYGEVGSATYTSKNGSKLGVSNFPGYSGTVFEPIDEYKGDFARSYFYFATRYPGKATQTANGKVSFSDSYPYLTKYAVNLFTKWSEEDPISQKEIDRNNAVYKLQKNRNPFIDHPEFINKIFGGNTSIGGDVDVPVPPTTTPVEKTDQEYANEVIALINDIGTVTESSGIKISKAENAYNKLTTAQKNLVTNYQVLVDAKEAFKEFTTNVGGESTLLLRLDSNDEQKLISGDYVFTSNISAQAEEDRGVQFTHGSINSSPEKKLIITSSSYTSSITSIKLNMCSNGDTSKAKVDVYVGETKLTPDESNSIGSSNANLLFTSSTPLIGELKIEYSNSATKKSIYIKSVTIN